MPDEFQYDDFLSHSAQDKAVVRPLAERLRADGVKVWFDEWVLKPGDRIERNQSKTGKIEEGLELFSFGFRVLDFGFSSPCLSANAFGSDWAALESGTLRTLSRPAEQRAPPPSPAPRGSRNRDTAGVPSICLFRNRRTALNPLRFGCGSKQGCKMHMTPEKNSVL